MQQVGGKEEIREAALAPNLEYPVQSRPPGRYASIVLIPTATQGNKPSRARAYVRTWYLGNSSDL